MNIRGQKGESKAMAGRMDFEEYKKSIENVKPEMRLRTALADIGCTIPIFTGKVEALQQDRPEKLYIVQVREIGRLKSISYPYSDAPQFRILIQSSQRKNLNQGDQIVFSAEVVYPLELRTAFLKAATIKRREEIEDQVGDLSSLDLKSVAKLISIFSPIEIPKLEKAIQQFNRLDETVEALEAASLEYGKEFESLNGLIEPLKSREKIEKMALDAQTITKTLDRLKDEQLINVEEIDERYTAWKVLLDKVENTLQRIDQISEFYEVTYAEQNKELPDIPIDDLSKINIQEIRSHMTYRYSENRVLAFLGTGKSMFARQIATAIGADYEPIEVQSNWTDASDLLGFYNPMYKRYQSTQFLAAIKRAEADPGRIHIICLEEMNLARVEYYFAVFLNMLQNEPESRIVHLLPDDVELDIRRLIKNKEKSETYKQETIDHLKIFKTFPLPKNLRFVATINDDDYTNTLSPKVIDRSFFIGFDTRDDDEGDKITAIPVEEYYCSSCFSIVPNKDIEKEAERILGNEWNPKAYRRNKYICEMYAFLRAVSKGEKLSDLIQKESTSRHVIQHPTMED